MGRRRKEEGDCLYMLPMARKPMGQMEGGGPSERYALGIIHFFISAFQAPYTVCGFYCSPDLVPGDRLSTLGSRRLGFVSRRFCQRMAALHVLGGRVGWPELDVILV